MPNWLLDAVAAGEVNYRQLAVLAFIIRRAHHRTREARFSLQELAVGIDWPPDKRPDTLARDLDALAPRWVALVERPQHGQRSGYHVRLAGADFLLQAPVPQNALPGAEVGAPVPQNALPGAEVGELVRKSDSPATPHERHDSPPGEREGAEVVRPKDHKQTLDPGSSSLRYEEPASPRQKAPAATAPFEDAFKDLLKDIDPPPQARAKTGSEEKHRPEDGCRQHRLHPAPWCRACQAFTAEPNGEGEQAVLAELDRFGAAGVVEEAAPLCPYPAHRGNDWRGDGGRLVCGVCHPPAEPSRLQGVRK